MQNRRLRMWFSVATPLAIAVITLAASSIRILAQETTPFPGAVVPPVVQFGGVLHDENGKPLSGTVGVTFLLYKDQQGGAPQWLETQNVQPDKNGRYTVQLGAASTQGLPRELFTSGEARWLAVQASGQPEQARIMLLSVPYALKAGDAETVGGLPASAFMLASSNAAGSATSRVTNGSASSASMANAPATSSNVTTTGGTVSAVPLWTTATNIQSSALTQTGTGATAKIGINTNTPAATLDVKGSANVEGPLTLPAAGAATATAGKNSEPQGFVASSFNSSTSKATAQTFQWQAEAASNDTNTPSGTLNLLFGSGTNKPAETGLRIASNGQINFAAGQTFPGAGTITGITAGTDLTGGGTGGNVTLSVDTSKVPLLAVANTFTGNQTVNGNLTATGLVTGNGFQIGSNLFDYGFYSSQNAFLGFAGNATMTGAGNMASGYSALPSDTTGGYNTAVGSWALWKTTTGSSNTAIGDIALSANTTGNNNVAVGTVAGGASPNSALTTGNSDTYLGAFTSSGTQTNLSNATAIGANAEVTASNSLVLGSISGINGATSSTNVGVGTTAPAYSLDVHGTGNFTGLVTFASNQTFPGAGTITAVNPGAGLLGGGNRGAVTLSLDTSKVVTGVSAGPGLAGGGTGGVPALSVDPAQVPFLNASTNTFNGNQVVNGYQAVNGNLYVQNNATYLPLSVQSSSTFGTWLSLNNTSTGGKQWAILSAAGTNAEGAGNLGITNFTGTSNIYLEGNVKTNTLSVNNDTPMSHNPHMSFSTTFVGSLCGGWVNCGYGTGSQWGAFVPDYNIVITRITATLNSAIDPSCPADIAVSDTTAGQLLGSVTLTGGVKSFDSGSLSIHAPAGHFITVVPAVYGAGCNLGASAGGDVYLNTQYVMQ